ncbi:MAG: phosphotransferase [Acidimicrobiales bacterium]
MRNPGPLLASGRDADIYRYGNGLVLRRSRAGRSMATEARVMDYVRQHGYPVPAVVEISDDGTDLVMERIDGPSMVAVLGRRPWTLLRQGRSLADLHTRLHEIPAPEWIRDSPCGSGDRLVHLDLHPLNIILASTGPIVIDWPNAARGDGNSDIAVTWVLLAAGAIPSGRIRAALMGRGRSILIHSMLDGFDVDEIRARLPEVVKWKVADPHMSAAERKAMWALVGGTSGPA